MSMVTLNWAQKAAHSNLGDMISGGARRAYVDMPTGTGKTGTFLNLFERFHAADALPGTLVLSPTKLITDNNYKELRKFAPSVHDAQIAARLTIGDLGDDSARRRRVQFMTYNSGIEALRLGLITPGLIILDEGQHALSESRREILAGLTHENIQIAFTASPEFSKDKSLHVAGYEEAYYLGLRDAVEGHLLADIRNVLVQMDEFEGVLDDIAMSGNDYDQDALEKIVSDTRLLDAAIKFYGDGMNMAEGKPIFGSTATVSCNSIAHSIAYAKRFNQTYPQGSFGEGIIGCAPIWGDMPEWKKDELLEKHKSGEILQLASKDYLIEGYDNPRISVAMNLRPTRSGVVAEQRGGRAIRFNEDNVSKEALVVDFVLPSKRNQQLLYGDVIGGFVFQKSSEAFKICKNKLEETDVVLDGLDVAYSESQIFSFLKKRDMDGLLGRNFQLSVYSPVIAKAMAREGIFSQDAMMENVRQFLIDTQLEHDPRYREAASRNSVINMLKASVSPFKHAYAGGRGERTIAAYNLTASVVSGVLKMPLKKLFGPVPEGSVPDDRTEFGGPDPDYIYPDGHDYDIDGLEERAKDMATPEEINEALEREYELNSADPDYNPLKNVDQKQITERITKTLSRLPPRHEFVLRARSGMGFSSTDEMTFEELGDRMGVTRERVRQLELKAFGELKHPAHSRYLRGGQSSVMHADISGKELYQYMRDSMEVLDAVREARKKSPYGYLKMNAEQLMPGKTELLRPFASTTGLVNVTKRLEEDVLLSAREYAQRLGYKIPGVWEEPYKHPSNYLLDYNRD